MWVVSGKVILYSVMEYCTIGIHSWKGQYKSGHVPIPLSYYPLDNDC